MQIRLYKGVKIKAFLFMLCFTQLVFSQAVPTPNIQPLDAKNGINKFKLCSFLEIHKVNLKETPNPSDTRVKWYTYTGTDVPTVFEYKVKQINLGYYKNKLFKITVQFDEKQDVKTDDIKNKLEMLFGVGKDLLQNADAKQNGKYVWEAIKVYLCFEYNEKEISLYMYSKILEKQIILDEL
ncbi:MAG TPA: hypothetical protein VK835_02380 [Bacteroidia bacterium]|nr:hypothetical protein [Bacteroidia bacterium]